MDHESKQLLYQLLNILDDAVDKLIIKRDATKGKIENYYYRYSCKKVQLAAIFIRRAIDKFEATVQKLNDGRGLEKPKMLTYDIVNQSANGKSDYRVYTYGPNNEELNVHDFNNHKAAIEFVQREKALTTKNQSVQYNYSNVGERIMAKCKECNKNYFDCENDDSFRTGMCFRCFEDRLEEYEIYRRQKIAERNEY